MFSIEKTIDAIVNIIGEHVLLQVTAALTWFSVGTQAHAQAASLRVIFSYKH